MRWFLALSAFLATGCSAAPVDWVQVGQAQRAQVMPKDVPTWIALIQLNREINHKIKYEDDGKQYHKSEWWVVSPRSNRGDCEDYALTKISEMVNRNLPGVNLPHMRLSVVQVVEDNAQPVKKTVYHAVAIWIDSTGNQWVLDNCCDVPFTKKQLEAGVYGIKYRWLWPS